MAGEGQTAELTGDNIKVKALSSIGSVMWMILNTDDTGHSAGFHLGIEKRPATDINSKMTINIFIIQRGDQ